MKFSRHAGSILLAMLLASCGQGEPDKGPRDLIAQVEPSNTTGAPQNSFGFMEAMEQGIDPFGEDAPTARQAVPRAAGANAQASDGESLPEIAQPGDQIAYTYGHGFRIDEEKIGELQQIHVGMCEAMAERCRVMRISKATADNWDGYGELELQVAAHNAAAFGGDIADSADQLGGELVSSVRDGEDLTEEIIDSEARLESRLVLREKLVGILRGNRGSVAELVSAEKAVADVNEEIDATRSKLQKLQNRIRYSAVRIEYEPYFGQTQPGFRRPIMTAARSIRTTLGMSIGFIIYAVVFLAPIILLVLCIRWILHRFGLRMLWWKRKPAATD